MEKYGFVYIWRDRKYKRYYIGCHWGAEDDGYICSSTWMKNAYKRRPEDFKKRILKTNILNKKQLMEEEYNYLKLMRKTELGEKYYNLCNYKFNNWFTDEEKSKITLNKCKNRITSEETRRKISQALKGRKYTDEQKEKYKNRKQSEETKLKIGKANKGHVVSDEQKEKIKKSLTGRKDSEETKIIKKIARNNLNQDKKLQLLSQLWRPKFKKECQKEKRKTGPQTLEDREKVKNNLLNNTIAKGRMWINNPETKETRMIYPEEKIPSGFMKGRGNG